MAYNLGIIGLVGIALILWYVGTVFLGITGGLLMTIVFIVGVLSLLKAFNVPFVKMWFIKSQRINAYVAVVALAIVGVTSGWFAAFGITQQSLGTMFTGAGLEQPEIGLTTCAANVAKDIRGTSATVTFITEDKESDSVTTIGFVPMEVRNDKGVKLRDVNDSAVSSITTAKVGDVLKIRGGNNTYYLDALDNFCVDGQQKTMNLAAHLITTVAGLEIIGYDNTKTTALGAAGNATHSDYTVAFGANEVDTHYVRLKVNVADRAFDLGAIATLLRNTSAIDRISITGGDEGDSGATFTQGIVPLYLKRVVNVSGDGSSDGERSDSGYDKVWIRSGGALRLREWNTAKYSVEVDTGGTDPVEPPIGISSVPGMVTYTVCFLDAAWSEDKNGDMQYSYYKQTISEENVGLLEDTVDPLGRDACVVVGLN